MPVIIERDVGLAPYNTFGVDAHAAYFARIASAADLEVVLADPELRALPRLVLGGGSNLLLTRDFDGLVIHVEIPGFESGGVEAGCQLVRVGAGQSWHDTVERTLHEGLPGLENLALIPGSIGAAPIQNIGAYGIELAERFHSLEALDTETGTYTPTAATAETTTALDTPNATIQSVAARGEVTAAEDTVSNTATLLVTVAETTTATDSRDGVLQIAGVPRFSNLFLPPEIERDRRGFAVTDRTMQTTLKGFFAARDVRAGATAQAASAAGEGAAAALLIREFLRTEV